MRPLTALALAVTAFVAWPTASSAQTSSPARTIAMADSVRPNAAPAPTRPAGRAQVTIQREAFSYAQEGRRDPFVSLMTSSELRPMISDLRLSVVVYDSDGDSRAVLRDINTNEQYKVRVGQQLGRMRVARIAPKAVTFTILEFGESRQETLALNDSTTARTP
ncbi:MAG TPA: hypothetical protein VK922_10635 [Gemmatimonadaceae bacterium]|nr:hypothetical protein [Gemmatimonadaceae bacterium]